MPTALPAPLRGPSAKGVGRLLLLPGKLISLFVLVVPLAVAFSMSFTDWSPTRGGLGAAEFIGLFNYEELLVDDLRFVEAVVRTLALAVICLSLEFVLGLAMLFLREFRGNSLFFSALLTPMMVLPVVVGYSFWKLFQSNRADQPDDRARVRRRQRSRVVQEHAARLHRRRGDGSLALDAAVLPHPPVRPRRRSREPRPRRRHPRRHSVSGVPPRRPADVDAGHRHRLRHPAPAPAA